MANLPDLNDRPGAADDLAQDDSAPMTAQERKVIIASSLGTVFEWYDFFLYGTLTTIIAKQFFTSLEATAGYVFALLAFAAGFIIRPLGAVIFGSLGDMVGRKYTFVATVLIMGVATALVAVLPTYGSIGVMAPVLLIALRLLQGLAIGGEYGGAAIYVAEHAPQGRRGEYTGWIQMTATIGLLLALLVVLATRGALGDAAFDDWGWRIPFALSAVMLAVSMWIRLSMSESPAFRKMRDEGKTSKAPLAECFGQWKNLKIIVLALFGLVAGQAVVWYTGQFYALYFLTSVLRVDAATANILMAVALLLGTPLFVIAGRLSDRFGRKVIIMTGLALACVSYFPLFTALASMANPALQAAQQNVKVFVKADPMTCSFQSNPAATDLNITSSCDIAKRALSNLSASYVNVPLPSGSRTEVHIGETVLFPPNAMLTNDNERFEVVSGMAVTKFRKDDLPAALQAAGYPVKADPAQINHVGVVVVLLLLMTLVAMVYGPLAATLVEMFPTRIRYTSMSIPYHIGNGWFGGLMPTIAFAMVAQNGNMYHGLWYPIIVAGLTCAVGMFFIRETKDVDIYAKFLYWHPNRLRK